MSAEPVLGYMVDSSWCNNPRGGRKYHKEGITGTRCGIKMPLAVFTAVRWEDIPDSIKCKRCKRCKDD